MSLEVEELAARSWTLGAATVACVAVALCLACSSPGDTSTGPLSGAACGVGCYAPTHATGATSGQSLPFALFVHTANRLPALAPRRAARQDDGPFVCLNARGRPEGRPQATRCVRDPNAGHASTAPSLRNTTTTPPKRGRHRSSRAKSKSLARAPDKFSVRPDVMLSAAGPRSPSSPRVTPRRA